MSPRKLRQHRKNEDDNTTEIDAIGLSMTSSSSDILFSNNPLLYPEILKIIFSWLESDAKTLRTCRQVCVVWNTEACNVLKGCNTPVKLHNKDELVSFHETVSKLNGHPEVFNGLIFCGQNTQEQHALYPPSARFWKTLKAVGNFVTFIDISLVSLCEGGSGNTLLKFKLPDLRKLLFKLTPNLTHLVLRELQKPLIQKQKFLLLDHTEGDEAVSSTKLKSLILKNEYSADVFELNPPPGQFHLPCPEFYVELLTAFPDIEKVGFYFHLGTSCVPYLEAIINEIEKGRLQKLNSIEKFIYGARLGGAYADSTFCSDLMARFKSINLRLNMAFVRDLIFNGFERSCETCEDLKLLGFHFNEENYLSAVNSIDQSSDSFPCMENLKRLCLRGGIPVEPFLLNAPNLQKLTISFSGVKTATCDFKSSPNSNNNAVKFWNKEWLGRPLLPLNHLWKLDIGHSAFLCHHDIKVIGKLCPNLKVLCVPSTPTGLPSVFQILIGLQELDIILFDEGSTLTDEMILGKVDDKTTGISTLTDLKALRIRLNEVSKLKDFYQPLLDKCLLTDAFLAALKQDVPKLNTFMLEAGNFTEDAWLSLNSDDLPHLRYLGLPKASEIQDSVLYRLRDQFPVSQVSFVSFSRTQEGQEIAWSGLVNSLTNMKAECNGSGLF